MEIGSKRGENTEYLLDFCQRRNAVLHVVDPVPGYDPTEWGERFADTFVFHRMLSLEAIPGIHRVDVALIDGDHNWFTVYNELKAIEDRCRADDHPFPLVIMHDVAWPYSRRDLYYEPSTIPDAYRHPYGTGGILPGSSALSTQGGLNRGMCNALSEGGPQNGVLTGIEDFMKQAGLDIELVCIPVFNGLGILLPTELKRRNKEVDEVFSRIRPTPEIESILYSVEMERISEMISLRNLKNKYKNKGIFAKKLGI
jgi:hypothetical protein